MADDRAGTDMSGKDTMTCHCGLPMSKNPHPDAGKPAHVVAVGAEFVCVPCTVKAMAGWSSRYHQAARENDRVRDVLTRLAQWDMLTLTSDGHGVATADAPWARELIASALSGGAVSGANEADASSPIGPLENPE